MIGKTVSHYRIIEKLGEGGMGVVYKAEDTKLRRIVALKFLPRELDTHEPERARFLQEAQAASALNHPNICAVHTLGEHEGQEFIDMEFVDGTTLGARLQGGQLKTEAALTYAIQIAEALQEAHSKGVVHRDIKPANIMVNTKNQIKVTDFGLAKLKGSLKLTKTSSTVGTLAYMAPEQLEGGEVDARSDIFSFGIVLYEMLTGHRPFGGEQEGAMINSILNDEPEPIQRYCPNASSELIHIIGRALEKNAEDRYPNAHEMLIDLRRAKKETSRVSRRSLLGQTAEVPRPVAADKAGAPVEEAPRPPEGMAGATRPATRRWLPIGIGIVVVLAVVAALLFTPLLPSRRVPTLNPNPTIRTLDVPFSRISYPDLSRDGNWVAFAAWDEKGEGSVYFMNVAKGAPRRLLAESNVDLGYAGISPDNSEVIYDRLAPDNEWGIYIVSSSDGAGRKIAAPGTNGTWRPDGERIGYVRYGDYYVPSRTGKREFWTVKPDGSDNRLEFADSLSRVVGRHAFAWSPDGKSIAWLRSFPGYNEIVIRELASGSERQLTSFKQMIDELTWAPNGEVFFASSKGGSTNIWMIPAKGGAVVQVTKGSGPDISARVSANGNRLLYLEERATSCIWTAGIDGSNARQLTFENQWLVSPSLSPDGKRIAFSVMSDDQLKPGSQVCIINSDGSGRTQATAGDGWHVAPRWSPDGKYLAYASYGITEPSESSRVYITEASNPGTAKLIGPGASAVWLDADRIYLIEPAPRLRPVLYSIHSSQPIEAAPDSVYEFALADGKHAYIKDFREATGGIWLKTLGESQGAPLKPILPFAYVRSATIIHEGLRGLLVLEPDGWVWSMSLPDCRRQRLPELFKNLNPNDGSIRLSWDGKQVVFLKSRSDSRLVLIDNLFK